MAVLVVEEHLRAEGGQHRLLRGAPQEEGLVDIHAPVAQRVDHPGVRRAAACGHDGDAHRAGAGGELALQRRQPHQQLGEGPLRHRVMAVQPFVRDEGLQPLRLVDALGLGREQHRVAVEGDADLAGRRAEVRRRVVEQRRGHAVVDRLLHVAGIARQEKVDIEGLQVAHQRACAAGEGRALDRQAVRLDRVEGAQAGVGRVARDHHHLDAALRQQRVEPQQRLHQREGGAGAQRLVLMLALVAGEGLDALGIEEPVLVLQVEEGPRGDADDELVGERVRHGDAHDAIAPSSCRVRS